MKLIRIFAWLLTVVVFTMPAAAMQPTSAMPGGEMAVHCHDPVPSPPPCPDHETAKHAAGTCCASTAATSALLPAPGDAMRSAMSALDQTSTSAPGLTGISQAKEPPPPRS